MDTDTPTADIDPLMMMALSDKPLVERHADALRLVAARIDEDGWTDPMVVSRSAPRWAWDVIDGLLSMDITCEDAGQTLDLNMRQLLTVTAMSTTNRPFDGTTSLTAASAIELLL